MKTFKLFLLPILCLGLASCSDDEEKKDNEQLDKLSMRWETEVSNDLLNVADVAYVIFKDGLEDPETVFITSTSTKGVEEIKVPCTSGIYCVLVPKESPTTQASYDLSLSFKLSLLNAKNEAVVSNCTLSKQSLGVQADKVESVLRTMQKLLDNAKCLYKVDADGNAEAFSIQSILDDGVTSTDLDALYSALLYADENGKLQPTLGEVLDKSQPEVYSVRVENLEEAKAMFLRWMPDAKQVVTIGNNLTWKLSDGKGGTLGSVYLTATDSPAGQVAKVTFDTAVKPEGITQINFLLSSAWPVNTTIIHYMGMMKKARAIKEHAHEQITLDGEVECFCINNGDEGNLAYYVGIGQPSKIWNTNCDILRQAIGLFASENTAKSVQDILNKPEESGGWGWDYYEDWFERNGQDITSCYSAAWINRYDEPNFWSGYGYFYEIDLNNGYQDYEITWHRPFTLTGKFLTMYVLVYKGNKLIEGNPID